MVCPDLKLVFGGLGGLPAAGPLLLTLLSSYKKSGASNPHSLTKNQQNIRYNQK